MTEQTCPTCNGEQWRYTGRMFDVEPCPDCTGRKEYVAAPGTSHIIPRDPVTGEVDDETSQPTDDAVERAWREALAKTGIMPIDWSRDNDYENAKELFGLGYRAALQASQRELHCAQESTDAAISDYNDALGRIAALEAALQEMKEAFRPFVEQRVKTQEQYNRARAALSQQQEEQ